MTEDNSHAGQGPVMLDIGDDIGAIILIMPVALQGHEIEARPIAGPALATLDNHEHGGHEHADPEHGGPEHADPEHADPEHAGHKHGGHDHGPHLVHVGVVERPSPAGPSCTAVFGELVEGSYELYVRPDGPVALTVAVVGGEVSTAAWPL